MSGFGGAVKLTGESEYRKALQQITQNLKEISSEMNVVSTSYDKNDKSIKALAAQEDVLNKKLNVMDTTATSLCMDNNIPIEVFGLDTPENIIRVVKGECIGTHINN